VTVIAFDGTTLAADKCMTNGMTRLSVTKIFKVYECLVGVCGDASAGMETLDWYRRGAVAADYPAINRQGSDGASLIVCRPDRFQ